jgi:dimethylargininase
MFCTHAITRLPGENFAQGLTTAQLGAPDFTKMLAQHRAYVRALESLDIQVQVLDALPGYPDAYFVEDVAVMLPQTAVITLPGAAARQGEQEAIQPVLARSRPLTFIHPPGILDGGDVLIVEKHAFIGVSQRTNQAGAEQLGNILNKYGYTWTAVPVGAGLHLKSSVNVIGCHTLLVSEAYAGHEALRGYDQIVLEAQEEYACNTLWINGRLITPAGFPTARQKLEALGLPIIELDISEARKMDGGLTCLSLRFSQED